MYRGSAQFQSYVGNLQRIFLVDFIDRLRAEEARREFRASLVENPFPVAAQAR